MDLIYFSKLDHRHACTLFYIEQTDSTSYLAVQGLNLAIAFPHPVGCPTSPDVYFPWQRAPLPHPWSTSLMKGLDPSPLRRVEKKKIEIFMLSKLQRIKTSVNAPSKDNDPVSSNITCDTVAYYHEAPHQTYLSHK